MRQSMDLQLGVLLVLALAGCTPADDKQGDTDVITSTDEPTPVVDAPVVRFAVISPTTLDDLVVVVDNPDTSLTYLYQWTLNGSARPDLTNATTVPSSATQRDDLWRVTVVATDADGASASGFAEATVGNTPPTATVTIDPADATSSTRLTVATTTDDIDGDEVDVSVDWYTNGVSAGLPDALSIEAVNLVRGDTWKVVVTPTDGTDAGLPVEAEVVIGNSAPLVTLARIDPATPRTTTNLSATINASDPDGDSPLSNVVSWYVNDPVTPVRTGASLSLTGANFVRGDDVWFTVVASDGTDVSPPVESNHVTIANTAPELSDLSLQPATATEATVLTCTPAPGGYFDLDGDPEGYQFTWKRGGSTITGATGATLTGANFSRGDAISCVAAPFDGTAAGLPLESNAVVIGNSLPVLGSVTISPTSPALTDTVRATVQSASDLDGDPITYRYRWLVNSTAVPGQTSSTLSTGFGPGQVIVAEVTPFDGIATGLPVLSNPALGANTLPVTDSVTLLPAQPGTADALTATAVGSDANGHTVTMKYRWRVNNVVVREETDLAGDGDVLASSFFVRGDTVAVTATPNDGFADGTPRTALVTIRNTLPAITGVTLTPSEAYENTTLVCAAQGWSDPDGDAEAYNISWLVGTRTLTGRGAQLTGSDFNKGDAVSCTVTPNDGTGLGTPRSSLPPIVIRNTAPVLVDATLSNTTPLPNDTISVVLGASSDLDNDAVTFQYAWYVDGELVPGAVSSTLPSTAFGADQEIYAVVTPFDGTDLGDAVTTDVAVGQNTDPEVLSVTLAPLNPLSGDDITVTVVAEDADGDDLVTTITWTINGIPVPGASDATLPSSFTQRGDLVRVEVVVADPYGGTSDPLDGLAGPIQVLNTPPSVAAAAIEPVLAFEDTTLSCVGTGWVDVDGDPPSYGVTWKVNGATVSLLPTLDGSSFRKGDVVTCLLTPRDIDPGNPGPTVTSPPVIISNTAPFLVEAELSNLTPVVDTVLTVVLGAASDLDADPLTYAYVWEVDGAEVSTATTLDSASFAKGQTVQAFVTVSDDEADGNTVATTLVTVGNTAPEVVSAAVGPSQTQVDAPLEAVVSTYDADDDTVTLTYTWYVDGSEVQSGSSDTLAPGPYQSGSEVYFEVTPNDGDVDGPLVTSNTVVIGNAPPSITTVTIAPTTIFEGTTVTCTASGWFDPDGDPEGYEYRWYVNGTVRSANASITGALFNKGDAIFCRVTPYDGSASGTPVDSAVRFVGNTLPSAAGASLSSTTPRELTTLTAFANVPVDVDGDPITTTIIWYVDGAQVLTGPSLSSGLFDKGQTVHARVTLSDGTASVFYDTPPALVLNTPPSVATVVLSPTAPTTTDDITLTYLITDPDPADASQLVADITWYIDGNDIGESGTTLSSALTSKGEFIYATVLPRDPDDDGVLRSAVGVTVVNTVPTVGSVTINPTPFNKDTPPTCEAHDVVDPDGDTITMTWRWERAGVLLVTTPTLQSNRYARGDIIRCFAAPFDGQATGATVGSDPVTVTNAPPVVTAANILPEPPREQSVLTVNVQRTDPDGDIPTLSYVWFVNGAQVATTASIDGTRFNKGDTVYVVVTPNDARVNGAPFTSPTVTIANTAPVVNGAVVITPGLARTNDTLTVTTSFSDADGDTVTPTYAWSVNGAVVQDSTSNMLAFTYFVRGDTVSVRVTPSDGVASGTPATSNTITIGNTTPSVPGIQGTPDIAVPGQDDILCEVIAPSTDPDTADTVTYQFEFREGASAPTTSTPSGPLAAYVAASQLALGEVWSCRARATDGTNTSNWSTPVYFDIQEVVLRSCEDYRQADPPATTNGVYTVDPDGIFGAAAPYDVYCEMNLIDGGWTRIIRTTGRDVDVGQRTPAIVSTISPTSATQGVYEAYERLDEFSQIMIKQVTGAQAGKARAFSGLGADQSMKDLLLGCAAEGLALGDDFAFDRTGAAGHTINQSGNAFAGDLMMYPASGPALPLQRVFVCGVNTSDNNDVSYLAFADESGNANNWGDNWRGQAQKGTIWSFANGNYCCSGDTHIGGPGLETLAGWKGALGTQAETNHAGTYEIYLR